MAKKYQAQLLTPEGIQFEGEVVSVTVPGSNGNFQVLYNHAPIVSSLGIGKITVKPEEYEELVFAVSGGFIEMSQNQLTILAEKAEKSDEIDTDEARRTRDEIREKLDSLTYNRGEVENELAIAENRLTVAESS